MKVSSQFNHVDCRAKASFHLTFSRLPDRSWTDLISLSFGVEGEWLTVQTARPDDFYRALPETAVQAGVTEMYSPDEDLESVFKYLVSR